MKIWNTIRSSCRALETCVFFDWKWSLRWTLEEEKKKKSPSWCMSENIIKKYNFVFIKVNTTQI